MNLNIKNFNDIHWEKVRKHTQFGGKHSLFLTDRNVVKNWLSYNLPEGYGLRVFKRQDWQGTKIVTATVIQNIFWINGMAPRVLAYVKMKDSYCSFWIQVVEYLEKVPSKISLEERKSKLIKIAKDNFIEPFHGLHKEIETRTNNWRGDKYVDFGGFKFKSRKKYRRKLIEEINRVTHFGKAYKGQRASYQSIPDWKVDGKRKTPYRIERIGLKNIDFSNKIILDVGCNLGLMLHYAKQKGAKRLIGYDLPDIVKVAKEFANYKKVFDIDFHAQDLTKEPPKEKADIVFFLAMSEYLGFPEWLPEVTDRICFYEGHAKEVPQETEAKLKKLFPLVKSLGVTEDRSTRPLFVCYNK